MSDQSKISWTDATWNPIRGCTRVSEGCRHCYAERVAARFSGAGQPYEGLITLTVNGPRWSGDVRFVAEHLADPIKWRKPRRIFVNSTSDLFHEKLANEQIAAVFGAMAACPHHTFQVLTKRAWRMRAWFEWVTCARKPYGGLPVHDDHNHARSVCCRCAWMVPGMPDNHPGPIGLHPSDDVLGFQKGPWPLPNVWLGVSAENQAAADERIPDLLATPAAVRWVSAEPLLGPLDFSPPGSLGYLRAVRRGDLNTYGDEILIDRPGLDWIVAGCESGPGARPADVEWFRELRDQCATAGVAFFLKQAARRFGEWTDWKDVIGLGPGSKQKAGGVIELPYLDGVQHAAFPEVTP